MDRDGRIRIGCTGWAIPTGSADAFPGIGSHLARYAGHLAAVEISSSFYRHHRPDTYARWAATVLPGFRFAVKLPRAVTHDARLGPDGLPALDRFLAEVAQLGDRLGPLLVQLPPSLSLDAAQATAFFAALAARTPAALACEPRHPSWFTGAGDALLAGHCQLGGRSSACDTCRMKEADALPSYAGYRFPREIIAHAVWRDFRFALSYRDVEELLAERGVIVTDETVRQWCRKFGQTYANALRRRRPRPGDTWHLDEVFIQINGTQHYLWRAVDQDGTVLDILVQSRRDKEAAKKFFRRLLKGRAYVPRVIISDKLASGVASIP